MSLAIISSLGIEAGQFRDLNSFIYFNITLNVDDKNFLIPIFKAVINFGRIFSPLVCLIFLFFYFFKNFKEIKNHFNLSILIFLAYPIFSIVGFLVNMDLYYYESYYENLWRNTYLSLQSITLFLLMLLLLSLPQKNFENYLKLIFLVLIIVYSYFSFLNVNNYLLEIPNLNLYATNYNVNAILMGYEVPRSSGIARVYLILIISILILLFNLNNKIKLNLVYFIILPLIICLLFLLNSRIAILSFFLMFFIIFILGQRNFIYKLLITILISLLSYNLFVIIPKTKNILFYNTQINKYLSDCNIKLRKENLTMALKQSMYKNYIQYKDDVKCNNKLLLKVEKDYPTLFMNNRDFYLNNIFEVKIDKKFNIIKFLFFQLDEMGEGRVSSAQKKNVYLESKNYETEYKNIINNLSTENIDLNSRDINKLKLQNKDFNYNKELKLLDRNSSIYKYIDIFSQSTEKLSSKPIGLARQQKSILDRLILNKNLTDSERLIVLIKLKKINEVIRFTNTLINCPYLESKINNLLTGRLCHWYTLLNETGIIVLGNGPKFDRNVVKWGASSALIYSYVTSGIFGLIFYIYISIKFLFFSFEFIKFRFFKKSFKTPIIKQIFYMILFFLLLRSILEGSFAYFGIDQLIFISIFIYYEKYIYKNIADNQN